MTTQTEQSPNPPRFGAWLKQRRKARGLTQHTLAEYTGYAVSTIRKIEAGVLRPSTQVAEQLAHALAIEDAQRPAFLLAARSGNEPDSYVQSHASSTTVSQQRPLGLPVPTTPLLGRHHELEHLTALVTDTDVRLLTLTGSGGIGKTRIALELARTVQDHFPDGVWFVPLSDVTDEELLIPAIGHALGLLDAGSRSVHERLFEYVQHAKTLIVLDNVEQLVAARTIVADMLARTNHLTLVCTSRIRLGVYGEHTVVVRPLGLPSLTDVSQAPTRVSSPAIDLFVQRAQALQVAFEATPAHCATVAQICHRLDGIPLAIELAAARSTVLSPPEILARLLNPLELLTMGPRTSPERHQTMRAAIDWSYRLLEPHEQQLFALLGTFAGGCTLEAVEAIGHARGFGNSAVLNGLTALIDASFVLLDHSDHTPRRFTMLEVLRDYARERLSESEVADESYRQHALYVLQFAHTAEPALVGPAQVAWLNRVSAEHDNIRAALSWSLHNHEPDMALGLAAALGRFWWLQGHLHEGKRWLSSAIALRNDGRSELRAKARYWEAILTIQQGNYSEAQVSLEECLVLYRQVQDESGVALAMNALGVVSNRQGNHAGAQAYYEAALARYRVLGDHERIATLLNNLGFTRVLRGDTAGAITLLEESLQLADQLGDVQGRAFALTNLGLAALQDGRLDDARAGLAESLELFWTLRDKRSCAECLEAAADLLLQQKQDAYVLVALRAADMLREQIGAPRSEREQERYARVVDATERANERGLLHIVADDGAALTESVEIIIRVLRAHGINELGKGR